VKNKVQPTGFWTFFCNPIHWAVDDFLSHTEEGTISKYMITTWQNKWFKIGQVGFIRVGHDQRNMLELNGKERLKRGIYALVETIELPKLELDFRTDKGKLPRYYVAIKYLRNYLKKPILLEDLKDDLAVRTDPYIILGCQASTMPLEEEAFNRILRYAEKEIA
jgi:hypothetical protein